MIDTAYRTCRRIVCGVVIFTRVMDCIIDVKGNVWLLEQTTATEYRNLTEFASRYLVELFLFQPAGS